jgi:glycosyltransferase involved in cell wall biosynthesis
VRFPGKSEMSRTDLVSVVIPAYNAAATIGETLRSVRSQTHRMLEILVIDDGSSDGTADVVRVHAALDLRIRLVRQVNGGVAAARNRGIKEAAADLIAFVDADDLWAPDKIEKQIAALQKGGPSVALVYTWYAQIDEASRITDTTHSPTNAGDVLERMCLGNLVGNGSSILVTKAALEEIGGFDPSLRARRAQGCEDQQFYFRMAERYHFTVVPERLTGYRRTSTNMSSDLLQMYRSWRLVADEMRRKHPRFEKTVAAGTTYSITFFLERALEMRRLPLILLFGALLMPRDRVRATRLLVNAVGAKKGGSHPIPTDLPRFIIGDPDLMPDGIP